MSAFPGECEIVYSEPMKSLAILALVTAAATPATHTSADFIRACANGAEPPACQTEFNHATGTEAYRAAFNVTICLPVPAPGGGQDLLIAAVNNEVGNFVEFGRFAIDYDQSCTISFGHQGESGGRPHHQRRADCEEKITVKSQLLRAAHLAFGHRLTERDRRRLDVTAAVGAIRCLLLRLHEPLAHPGQLVTPAAIEA